MIINTNLNQYFPMIRTREEVLKDIRGRKELSVLFDSWEESQQEEFLDFCTGVNGVKMLYDTFFKEILNPEYASERLSDFLSVMLGQRVKILKVLPNDSTRIADENALLITDIVVELEDGSIANVEIQKIGYMFPGERAACYSADLLLRQYKRVRDERKKKFTYRDVKPVYVIVLFEKSPAEFQKFKADYIHCLEAQSDTGIQLNLLQKYYFVALDIFKETMHNKGVTDKKEAWLTFLCADEPEAIEKLIITYPEFKSLYEDVYQLCLNIEKVMDMFSTELRMLDRNTTQFMIDDMQETINEQQEKLDEQQEMIDEQQEKLDEQQEMINEQQEELTGKREQLAEKDKLIRQLQEELNKYKIEES